MYCVDRKYDEAVGSTAAGNEVVRERILRHMLYQVMRQAKEMNDLQRESKPACQEFQPREVETIIQGRINNRKRQKKRKKHNKELAKENEQRSASESADGAPETCRSLDSLERDHVELRENLPANNLYDKVQELQQKSQSGNGSGVRRMKKFLRSLKVSKSFVRKKLDKQKNPSPTFESCFCVLNKGDKKSLRLQLSIWFPCLFPRPTFKILQEAIVRMTNGICRDLCRIDVKGMNQQISKTKAQRTLFRKEQMRERYSTKQSTYFVSNVVPECQKAVSSIAINSFKGGSTTSRENCSRIVETGSRLSKTTECVDILIPLSTVDDVAQGIRELTCPTGEKSVAQGIRELTCPTGEKSVAQGICELTCPTGEKSVAQGIRELTCPTGEKSVAQGIRELTCPTGEKSVAQTNNVRQRAISYYGPEPLRGLGIQHHLVPEWFRSMIRKKAVIYILPAESKNDKRTSSETKHLMMFQRRILFSGFHHGGEMSSANEHHMFVSVLEQESTSQSGPAFTRFRAPGSTPRPLETTHVHSSGESIHGQDNRVSVQDEGMPVDFGAEPCVPESCLQTRKYFVPHNLRGLYCSRPPNFVPVNYDREDCADLSLENQRQQIRKYIHSRLQPRLESDASHKQYVGTKTGHPEDPQLPSARRHNSCNAINNSNSKNIIQSIDGGEILSLSPKFKSKNVIGEQYSTTRPPKSNNSRANISLMGTEIRNVDANLNKNIDALNEYLCGNTKQTMVAHNCYVDGFGNLERERKNRNNRQEMERLGKLRNVLSPIFDNASVTVASEAASKPRDCQVIAPCHERDIGYKAQAIEESIDAHPKKYEGKKVKKVRFNGTNRQDEKIMDNIDKSNSSVHEVFDGDLKIVIDDVKESKQFNTVTCTVGTNLLSISQGETARSMEADGMNETVSPKASLAPADEPGCDCSRGRDKKCTNVSNLYLQKDFLADKLNIVVASSRCEMGVGNKDTFFESSSLSCAQNWNAQNCSINNREVGENLQFYGSWACRDKSRGKKSKNDLSRHEGPHILDAKMRETRKVPSRESLTNFVKEQWRFSCHTSRTKNPKTLSVTDVSQNRQCVCEQKTTFGEPESSPFDLPNEPSTSYSTIKSLFWLQEVASDDGMKSRSLRKEPSYEAMCTDRRENYRKLSRILTNYYESVSEDVGDVRSNSLVRSPQLSEADSAKSQVGIKASASLVEKEPLELKCGVSNPSPESTISTERTTSTTNNRSYSLASIDRSQENVFEESEVSSVARFVTPGTCPTSSNSDGKAELNLQNAQVPLAETTHRTKTNDTKTQTSPTTAFQVKPTATYDSITPKLNLYEEAEWPMRSLTSGTTAGPQQTGQFYYTIFTLDKLLAQYSDLACAERHSFKMLNGNSQSKKTYKKSTLKIESALTCSSYKQFRDSRSGDAFPCASRDAQCQAARGEEEMSELAQNCSVNNGQDSPPMNSFNRHFTEEKATKSKPKKLALKSRQPTLDPVPEILTPKNSLEKQSLAWAFENKRKSPNGHFSQSPTEAASPSPDKNIVQSPAINISLSRNENISQSIENIPSSWNGNIQTSKNGNIPKTRNGFISKSPRRKTPPSRTGNIKKTRTDFISKSPTSKTRAVRTGNALHPIDINSTGPSHENIQQFQTEYMSRFQPWNISNSTIPSTAFRTGNAPHPIEINITTPSHENIQQFQTEYMSRFQPWNISNSTIPSAGTKEAAETAHFTGQRLETHLVKGSIDTDLKFPSHLSLMSQYSNTQQPLLGDMATYDSTKELTSVQPVTRPDFKSYKYSTEQKVTLSPVTPSPVTPTLHENYQSEAKILPCKNDELPKNCWAILNSSREQNYAFKSADTVAQDRTDLHYQLERREFLSRETQLSNFDSVLATRALLQSTERSYGCLKRNTDSTERSCGSVKRNTDSAERSYGCLKRNTDSIERSYGCLKRNTDSIERSYGSSKRNTDSIERSYGSVKRNTDSTERSYGSVKRNTDSAERSYDSSKRNTDSIERSYGSVKRNTDSAEQSYGSVKRNTDSAERSYDSSKRNTDSAERSYGSSKRNTDSAACKENRDKVNTAQCQTPYQIPATGTKFENMCDRPNKTPAPTSCSSGQSTNSQAKSKYEMEFIIGAERQYEATLSNDTHTKYGTYVSIDTTRVPPARMGVPQSDVSRGLDPSLKNISQSPREPNTGGFAFVEVDNRLLDPSKHYNDVSILQDSCKQEPTIPNCTVVSPKSCTACFEEKRCSNAADRFNSLPTRQYIKKSTQLQDVDPTAEFGLESPCPLSASTFTKGTNGGINVYIQTCACISQPNGTCTCGYLSINNQSGPTQTVKTISSKSTAKTAYEINGKSISLQLSKDTEKPGKEENIYCRQNKCNDFSINYQAQPGRRKPQSPNKIKYRNKKCQMRVNVAAKGGLTNPATCQRKQPQSSARNCVSPIIETCTHESLDSYKMNNKFTLRKETAPCNNCNKLLENTTRQCEARNLSSEVTTNSSDDSECRICQGKNFEQNTSNTFPPRGNVQVCSDWKQKGGKVQEPRERRDYRCGQDSGRAIVAKIAQGHSSDESANVEGKRPIVHVQCKLRHGRNASQCQICRDNVHILSQQLMEQISGIIKNSKLLQEQATQLRKKCKSLDQQQWLSDDWARHDTQDQCKCDGFNLRPDCENNNQNPVDPSDKNANANLACSNVKLESNLQGEHSAGNVSSLAASCGNCKCEHDTLFECKLQRNSASTLAKLCKEIHTKNYHLVSDTHVNRRSSLFSSINECRASSCSEEKRKRHSSDCELSQHSNGHLYARNCRLWVKDDNNQSCTARPVAQENRTDSDSKLQRRQSFPDKQYFFNDPSEDAYRYMRAHFPAVSMRPLHEEGENVGGDTRENVGSGLLTEGDRKLAETQPRVRFSVNGETPSSSATGANEHFQVHDLRGAELTKSFPLSERAWIKGAKSDPGIRVRDQTNEATVAALGTLISSRAHDTQHPRRSVARDYRDVQPGVPSGANSVVHENKEGLSLIAEYKTDAVSLPGRSDWHLAYNVDSFSQGTIPIKSAKNSPRGINAGSHETLAPHNDFIRNPAFLSEDYNGISLHTVTRSTGTLVVSRQITHQMNVTPGADKRCIVSTPGQVYGQSCCHCSSSAASHLLKDISEPAVHESDIRSHQCINKELHAPVVCAENMKTYRLRQNQESILALDTFETKTEYLGYRAKSINPEEPSLLDSLSETSLISVGVDPVSGNITVPRFDSFPLTSVDVIDSKGCEREVKILCGEERQHLNKLPAVVGSDSEQQQSGGRLQRRNKKGLEGDGAADNALSREARTRDKSEHEARTRDKSEREARNKHRILPEIKRGIGHKYKLSAVDSQDSSHGIDDLPLDSSSTEVAHLKRNGGEMKKSLRDATLKCNGEVQTECKNIILDSPGHKRALFARPLPLPTYDRGRSLQQNDEVKQTKIDTAEHPVSTNYSSVITTEHRLPTNCSSVITTEHRLPTNCNSVITTEHRLPTNCSSVITTEHPVPTNCSSVITTEHPVPTNCSSVITTGHPVPTNCNSVITTGHRVPTNCSSVIITEHRVPTNCSSVITTEHERLPTLQSHVDSAKPHLKCYNTGQIALGGKLNQFEVSADCTDIYHIVAETIDLPVHREFVVSRNSPENWKGDNPFNDTAKFRTSLDEGALSFSKGSLNDSDNSSSSAGLGIHPSKQNSTTGTGRVGELESQSLTVSQPLQNGNSLSDEAVRAENILKEDATPKNLKSLEIQTDTGRQWRPCLFGCAEVTSANDNSVIIEGAYVKRFPSGSMSNESVAHGNNSDGAELSRQQRKVVPFRLMLYKDMAHGDSNHVIGTYTRQLLTGDDFFTWNLIADIFP